MRRLTFLTIALTLTLFAGCNQTAEDRYQRYLEEVADSSSMIEYITPEEDPVAPPTDDGIDAFSNDDDGVYTIPEIPKERKVNMNANTYELEKMMSGRE